MKFDSVPEFPVLPDHPESDHGPGAVHVMPDGSLCAKGSDGVWHEAAKAADLIGLGGLGGSAPDATALTKGIVRLTGDLGGTASNPTVPGLAGKADSSHTHPQSQITNLVSDLAAKANTSHTHTKAEITDFSHTHLWADITDKPSSFSPSSHTHTQSSPTSAYP